MKITLHFHVQTSYNWNKATHAMEFQQRIQPSIKNARDQGLSMGGSGLQVDVFSSNIFKIMSDQRSESEVHILTSIFLEIRLHD